jgi:hypothetical protein
MRPPVHRLRDGVHQAQAASRDLTHEHVHAQDREAVVKAIGWARKALKTVSVRLASQECRDARLEALDRLADLPGKPWRVYTITDLDHPVALLAEHVSERARVTVQARSVDDLIRAVETVNMGIETVHVAAGLAR